MTDTDTLITDIDAAIDDLDDESSEWVVMLLRSCKQQIEQLQREVDRLHDIEQMKMSTEKPNKPGAYWFQDVNYDSKPHVVNVRDYAGELAIENWVIPDANERHLWAGPLPEPEL